ACGLKQPGTLAIVSQIAFFHHAEGVQVGANSFGAVMVDAAAANDWGPAFIDGHSRLSVIEHFRIENLSLASWLHGDAEFLTVVNPAMANQRIAVVADAYFRKGVSENLRFFDRPHARIADQNSNVGPLMNLTPADDGVAPVND